MDTHPEEFLKGNKWDVFMPFETKFKHFTKLEQYLIRRKYRKMVDADSRQRAYDGILETLVFKEDKPESVTYSAPPHLGIWGTSAVSTLASNTLTIGNETLDAETIKHMKAHLEAMRKEQQEALHQEAKRLYKTSS